MMKTNSFQRKRTTHPTSYSIAIKIALAVIIVIVSQATLGQFRVDTRAPVFVNPMGARTTIRYASSNIASRSMWVGSQSRYVGASSALLPSEHRFATRGQGLLPSEARYSRFAPGVLPSERRVAYSGPSSSLAFRQYSGVPYAAMGSIRYGTRSASTPAYARAQRTAATVASVQTPTPNILYSAQGTIRYGTTKTSFSKKLITNNNALAKSNLRTTNRLQGSIRYSSSSQTMPITTGLGFVPSL
jgi:hypothetical protein